MSTLEKSGELYRNIFRIALPIALQNLIIFAVSATDTFMLGRLGETQLSASAQANQPQFVFMILTFGLAGGGSVLTAQYWGKKDLESVKTVIGIVLRVSAVVSLVLSCAVLIFPREIMSLYLKDPAVIEEAVKYLRIVGWGYFFFGISNSFINIIRSVEIVKISVIISLASFILNAVLDYILIFGKFGAPRLEIEGAAIGTLCARILEFLIITVYALFIDKKLTFKIKYIFIRHKQLSKDYVKYSIPVVCNELMWALGITLQAAVLGKLSTEIVSASSISNVLQQLATIAIFGVANAASVIVGKKIGEGNLAEAKSRAFSIMIISFIAGFLASVLMFSLRKQFVSFYNITEETRILSENLLIITSVLVFFVSVSATSIVGVLRGAGDTKFCLKLEMITLWFIAIPLGLAAAFIFNAPALLTFALLKIDEPIKSVIAFIRTLKDKAYRNVTR